jgi:hypothetical protein
MFSVVLLSLVILALDKPGMKQDSNLAVALYLLDVFTTIMFIGEALIKSLTFGFLMNGEHSYLKDPWNLLDFTVVIFSIISVTTF